MAHRTVDDLEVGGKRVLVRVDFNVPWDNGRITDFTRIDRTLPTIRDLSDKGAKIVLLAHFGRPKGEVKPELSLRPLAEALAVRLGHSVSFAADCIGEVASTAIDKLQDGAVLLLENTRFHKEEMANDNEFAVNLAELGDLYVNDAFSCAHRAHASTEALAHKLPSAAGRCLEAELSALRSTLEEPRRPLAAVVGGAKVSTKLDVLGHLIDKVDELIVAGAMANTFLEAQGLHVGKSLSEHDLAGTAREIIARAEQAGCRIELPVDAVVASEFKANTATKIVAVSAVPSSAMILDIGPDSIADLKARLTNWKTVLWNGPLGAFETPPFNAGTSAFAKMVAAFTRSSGLVSVAGGGDTVAAIQKAGVYDDFTYVSTGGGAFLEWLEGRSLPGIKALGI